ncbi:MAG: phytoene/squalene synthase family protein [Deltaproteobacteria bacterium]|nr:phytoene/squalene synthase family protein [Deltaproteobacteria bacterium]
MHPETVLKQSKTSFDAAFWGLNKDKKRALSSIYAFCRVVDDTVDEATDDVSALIGLTNIRKKVDVLDVSKEIFFQELHWSVQKFSIPVSHLYWLMDGVLQDISQKKYQTWNDLFVYCDAVASSVGYMCMDVFEQHVEIPSDYVIATGRALQLTNIARDIFTDSAMNRIYIPQEHWTQYEITQEDFLQKHWSSAFETMVLDFLQVAGAYFQQSAQTYKTLDRKKIWPAEVMKGVYAEIYRAISKHPKIILSNKVTVPIWKKFWISRKQYIGSFF